MLVVIWVIITFLSCYILHSTHKRKRTILSQKVISLKKHHTIVSMKHKIIYINLIKRNNLFIKTKLII